MRYRSVIAAVLICSTVTFVGHAASAASSSTSSSASSSSLAEEQPRDKRVRELRAALGGEAKVMRDWTSYVSSYDVKRSKHRSECRQDFRQSNRDTKLPTLLRCYRGDLSLEREMRRRERDVISATAGVTAEVRAAALKRSDLLLDAINTLLNAIDSDVYTSTEDLLKAKRKLASNYRDPLGAAMTRLRSDRLLSWTDLVILDLSGSGTLLSGSGGTISSSVSCFSREEAMLKAILTNETGSTALQGVLQRLPTCTREESAVSSSASSAASTPST